MLYLFSLFPPHSPPSLLATLNTCLRWLLLHLLPALLHLDFVVSCLPVPVVNSASRFKALLLDFPAYREAGFLTLS